MFKMLIVEDERWEREGLSDFLNWSEYGVEVCALACDGIEGLEMARRLLPEIIITDIKMPGLDGLKMAGRVREFLPDVKIIILTGYDDFQLAREAINISADAYILKPVEELEMKEVIKKVSDECKADRTLREEQKSIKDMLDESLRISEKNLLIELLKGRDTEDAKMRRAMSGINFPVGSLAVIAIKSQDPGAIEALLAGRKEDGILGAAVDAGTGTVLACVGCNGLSEAELVSKATAITLYAREYSGFDAVMGTGGTVETPGLLHLSFQQAMEALSFAVFWNDAPVMSCSELEGIQRNSTGNIGDYLIKGSYYTRQLLHSVRFGDDERAFALLDEMFDMIGANKWVGRETVANYLYGLVNEVTLLLYNLKVHPDFTGEAENMAGGNLLSLAGLKEMKAYIYDFVGMVFEKFQLKKSNKDELIIKKVEQIVYERYNSDISLKTIAAEVYLSPNYLGSIFKRLTGTNFNEFVCNYRMEKAKELLQNPKCKVSSVASHVGISNLSYFCILFKNKYGVAPGEFHEMVIRGL